jgi:hypothetical protein
MKEYVTQLGAQELLLSKVHVHMTTALFIAQEYHHHLHRGEHLRMISRTTEHPKRQEEAPQESTVTMRHREAARIAHR